MNRTISAGFRLLPISVLLLFLSSCASMLITPARRGDLPLVERLVEKGAEINAKNVQGNTALIAASMEGHAGIVEFLIESGGDVQARNKRGNTALISAAGEGHLDVAGILIQAGATVDTPGSWGRTALIVASGEGHQDIVELLLDSGANVEARMTRVFFEEEYYTLFGPVRRYYYLPSTALMAASSNGHTGIIKLLVAAGAEVGYTDSEGFTALKWAFWGWEIEPQTVLETVMTLVAAGADGPTALQMVRDNFEIVMELTDRLSRAGAPDAFSLATSGSYTEIAAYLCLLLSSRGSATD